ncbi:hypothetical protein [Anaerosporobacter faecicola]|uniref:hypothetical protein n=1 Tax=Anaerosporobacter faecicola TaxID=2718714 RepID=UPI00143A12DC|nr:hypothetical protein [Anaerosporobacter faecicola]
MKRTREQQDQKNKARCKSMKEVRYKMAAELGIKMEQRECPYEGFCTGTCPACQKEEEMLNEAIKKQRRVANQWKKKTALAGILAASTITMTSCNWFENKDIGGKPNENIEDISGNMEWYGDEEEPTPTNSDMEDDTDELNSDKESEANETTSNDGN